MSTRVLENIMTEKNLSIGKYRGLASTSTPQGMFTILAFDHRQSFVKMVPSDQPGGAAPEEVVEVKTAVVRALAPHASAVLLDPLYSAAQTIANGSLPGQTGLLVAVEESGYTGEPTARITELMPEWNVTKIKRMGADAVKLLVYYHPDAGMFARQQEDLVRQLVEDCREADILFYLEPVSYSIDPAVPAKSAGFAAQRPELITRIARRLGSLGPDVLKLEFPVDANYDREETSWRRACESVSAASPCPWAVLSAGVNFDLFLQQVEIACQAGASGFIGGRAVWKEGIGMAPNERDEWLRNVAAPRLDALSAVALKYARPWTAFFPYAARPIPEGWYRTYGE